MRNQYTMLAIVLLVGVGLDQYTKWWADSTLGTPSHPVPVTISAADASKTLGEVLAERLGLDEAALQALEERGPAKGVSVLDPSKRSRSGDPAFPVVNGKPRLAGYWAFHHGTLERPPRRLPSFYREVADFEEHGDADIGGYMEKALPYLGEEQRAEVVESYLYRVDYTRQRFDQRVSEGQVYLVLYRPVNVIDGFFRFTYAENPGAAWGFLSRQSDDFRKWFFLCVSLLAISVISAMFYRLEKDQKLAAWGFAIILSGAVGNFIDRLRFNFVVDFIDMYVGETHWPTYNVADIAITAGVILLLVEVFVRRDRAFLSSRPASPPTGSQSEEPPEADPPSESLSELG